MTLTTAIGYALGVAGIAATWYFARSVRPRRLAFDVIRNVVARQRPDWFHATIRVMNKGREPITRLDYDEEVTFICRALALTASVGDTSPKNLRVEAVLRDGRLGYQPVLLNRGDWFELVATFGEALGPDRPLDFFVYRGHVAGIEEIEDWAHRLDWIDRRRRLAGAAGGVLLVAAGLVLVVGAGIDADRPLALIGGLVFSAGGLVTGAVALNVLRPGTPVWPRRRASGR